MATTPKGTEIDSMKIKGTLDISDIDNGIRRIEDKLDSLKGTTKSFGSDMQRVSNTIGGLAKKMIRLGVVGSTALIGIASQAPAVAPAIAKMGVEFGKLSRSLGEALAPAFDSVGIWMGKLASWVDENKLGIQGAANVVIGVSEKIGSTAVGYLSAWIDEYARLRDVVKTGQDELKTNGMFSTETEKGLQFNVPNQGATALGVGIGVGAFTRSPTAGVAAGALTYGGLEQMERTTEFQARLDSGEASFPALVKSFSPGAVGDFYAWIYNIFAGSESSENRRMQSLSQSDAVWG